MPATARMTAEEYLARPWRPEWPRTQLVEGEEIEQEPLESAPGRRTGRPYPVPELAVEVRSPSTCRLELTLADLFAAIE